MGSSEPNDEHAVPFAVVPTIPTVVGAKIHLKNGYKNFSKPVVVAVERTFATIAISAVQQQRLSLQQSMGSVGSVAVELLEKPVDWPIGSKDQALHWQYLCPKIGYAVAEKKNSLSY